jgi:hypothetical protein
MTSEWAFNSQVPAKTLQKKQLTVKSGPLVRASHSAVIIVTASCEVRSYVWRIVEIVPQTGGHPW